MLYLNVWSGQIAHKIHRCPPWTLPRRSVATLCGLEITDDWKVLDDHILEPEIARAGCRRCFVRKT